ncbi:MAG TPA: hypothetical protein PKL17_01765 [Pseudomonadota bacterium]|jgi:hypothetical protein|nr:hypothetical protein [Pseudomonadota bacterium]HNK43480.1 hypothetical protein [Pseudomonadota bacterium]
MHKPLLTLLVGLSLVSACGAPTKIAQVHDANILPLRSVRLYETGIGYFERAGTLGSRATVLPVPAGHIDDALKTLVVLSRDQKTRVFGLEFASSVSPGMGRALAGLPLSEDDPIDFLHLLRSCKGGDVSVRVGQQSINGRLIDIVEHGHDGPVSTAASESKNDGKDQPSDGKSIRAQNPSDPQLLLLSQHGELLRLPLSRVTSVRPLDPSFAPRLRTALDATSQRSANAQRLIRLLSRDGGPVTIGYVAEAPLWRVSYRLVVSETGKGGVLQGWALIHNDTDEDWQNVQVHLVNGRPDSFLFPLAAPRYARRTLITPDNQLSTVPQLLGQSADQLWGDNVGDSFGVGGLGLSGMGAGGGGRGEGSIGLGSIGTIGHGSGVGTGGTGSSSLLQVGNLAATAKSTGVESGALFTYSLGEPLELRAHGSALVPFVQDAIEVETITFMPSPGEPARSGLRFTNSTRQTIPGGTLAVLGETGLLGESALPRLKPSERRFIEYGVELDVEVSRVRQTQKEEPQRLTFSDDEFEEHFLRKRDQLLRIENRSGQTRQLYLALNLAANSQVQGADRLDFDHEKKSPVAIFELAPQSRAERPLTTMEGLVRRSDLRSLQAARLLQLSTTSTVPATERSIAAEAYARQKDVEDAAKEVDKVRGEIKKTEKDLERLREHLKALGKDSGAGPEGNPLVKRILEAEDRLSASQKRLESLESDQDRRRDAVRKVLERLPKNKDKSTGG